jgi:hypothetical protein
MSERPWSHRPAPDPPHQRSPHERSPHEPAPYERSPQHRAADDRPAGNRAPHDRHQPLRQDRDRRPPPGPCHGGRYAGAAARGSTTGSSRGLAAYAGALAWRRSSRSTGMNNCVEAARLPDDSLAVRDSKDVSRSALRFTAPAWTRFVTAMGTGNVSRLPGP